MWKRDPTNLRTYQRKAKKPAGYLVPSFTSVEKYNLAEDKNRFRKSGLFDNSLNDPFETTFDRIAREV